MPTRNLNRRVVVVESARRVAVQLSAADFLQSGASGEVYRLNDRQFPASCIKLYHKPDRQAADKLQAMLQHAPDGIFSAHGGQRFVRFAWPTHLVEDGQGSVIGFLMPEIDFKATRSLVTYTERREAQRFLSPEQRSLPRRLAVCINLCALMADLHRQGHAFVDFKDQNVRVYPDHDLVGFIDNDGFRIKGDAGRVFAGLYTTPTFNSPESVHGPRQSLAEQHDRFVLAILMFRILNHGIHPFQGVPRNGLSNGASFDIDRLIEQQTYAYGAHTNADLAPTLGSLHEYWDSRTLAMFERTFTTRQPKDRVSAIEWVRHLRSIQQAGLMRCSDQPTDIEHVHFAGNRCPVCKAAAKPSGGSLPSAGSSGGGKVSGTPISVPSQPVYATAMPVSSAAQAGASSGSAGLPPPERHWGIGAKLFMGVAAVLVGLWLAAATGLIK